MAYLSTGEGNNKGDSESELKGTEEKVKVSDARFRSLFENSFDALLLTEPDGTVLSANPAACRMFGMTEEEIKAVGRKNSSIRLS